jgi:DNA-binding LacI/PurR family transcriptional regulator
VKKPVNEQLRIVVRLYDWSDWCRQVLRGIQGFARAKADWRIYVAAGPAESAGIYGLDQYWDGILTHVLDDHRAIARLMKNRSTKIVSFTAAIHHRLKNIPAVRVNETMVARTIGEHLLAGGCRHLAYMGVPSDINNFRWIALSEFAKSAGLPCDILGHRRVGRISMLDLVRGLKQLEKPVGVVTWSMPYAREIVQGEDFRTGRSRGRLVG